MKMSKKQHGSPNEQIHSHFFYSFVENLSYIVFQKIKLSFIFALNNKFHVIENISKANSEHSIWLT